MGISKQALGYGQRRVTRKLIRSVPFLGALVAVGTLAAVARRKGLIRGSVDTALDFTPLVGAVKNGLEILRGRDFIPDRPALRK